jgi:hypothetical protein
VKQHSDIAGANARFSRKLLVVALVIALINFLVHVAPSVADAVALRVSRLIPSVAALVCVSAEIGQKPYQFFGLAVPLLPVLAVYLCWNGKVVERFRIGQPQTGRSRPETLIALYLLFVPAALGSVAFAWFADVDLRSSPNTFGAKLIDLMLRTDVGLLLVGGVLLLALVVCLTLLIWCVALPLSKR